MSESIAEIKVGDKVLVDVGRANGGYEAEVLWVGDHFARITDGEYIWDIMKNRLQLKSELP